MSQTASCWTTTVLGTVLTLAFGRPLTPPFLIVGIASSAWLGIGLFAIVRGQLTLGSTRGGGSPHTQVGNEARITGAALVAGSVVAILFVVRVIHL